MLHDALSDPRYYLNSIRLCRFHLIPIPTLFEGMKTDYFLFLVCWYRASFARGRTENNNLFGYTCRGSDVSCPIPAFSIVGGSLDESLNSNDDMETPITSLMDREQTYEVDEFGEIFHVTNGKEESRPLKMNGRALSLKGLNQLFIGALKSEATVIEQALIEYAKYFESSKNKRGKLKEKVFSQVMEEQAKQYRLQSEFLERVTLINLKDYTQNILPNVLGEIVEFFVAQEKLVDKFKYFRFSRYLARVRRVVENVEDYLTGMEPTNVSDLLLILSTFYSDRGPYYLIQGSEFFQVRQRYQSKVYIKYGLALTDLADNLSNNI